MKKYLIIAMFLTLASPFMVRAEAVTLTDEARTQLITELKAELVVLYQQLIQELLDQMNANTDKIITAIQDTNTQTEFTTAMVSAPQATLSLEKICRVGSKHADYRMKVTGDYTKGTLSQTATDQDGTNTSNFTFTSGNEVLLGGEPTGTPVDYTFSLKDASNAEVGSLTSSLTVESCE